MAVKYLGQPFDIHTASTDLTFPHGDNEIAIACGINGKPLAKFWMHSEVVMADGKKVSRGSGNDLTLQSLLDAGFDGPTVRYWLLATHYRKVLKYSREELARAGQCVRRLNEFVVRLREFKSGRHNPDLDQVVYDAHMGWQQAMDHDLNVSRALGKLFAFVRHGNRLMNDGKLDEDQARQVLDVIVQANRIIEIVDLTDERIDSRLEQLFEERNKARQNKDFQRADALRDELRTMGIQLTDRRSGTRWKRV
jgi:cysteinyl-tRNA synthetase